MLIANLTNMSEVPAHIRPEIQAAVGRALEAGAPAPLTYVGVGMYGIVLCDVENHAWKVARWTGNGEGSRQFILDEVASEYEWLRDAARSPISGNVAKVYAIHPEQLALERECVAGRPGGWADDKRLGDLHTKIERAMIPLGWTAPEFKENSYIIRDDGTPVLVDISQAQRVGMNLVGYVKDVLEGKRATHDSWRDLAFYLLREMGVAGHEIPEHVAKDLVDRLNERDPEIKKNFITPKTWST